jgi:hypothetical protein
MTATVRIDTLLGIVFALIGISLSLLTDSQTGSYFAGACAGVSAVLTFWKVGL